MNMIFEVLGKVPPPVTANPACKGEMLPVCSISDPTKLQYTSHTVVFWRIYNQKLDLILNRSRLNWVREYFYLKYDT